MSKRSEFFTEETLTSLFANHPYLGIFQKEDCQEYLHLLASIYDLLESDNARIPFEVLRSFVIKFYAHKKLQFIENKVTSFFVMMIGELMLLQDSHDSFGQRFVEATRAGKELLQHLENLMAQRTKFSGTGAETLLGALNRILISRQSVTEEQALEHHREKIKAYQADIQKIKSLGLAHAELLPIPHSNDALFNQAEEAALHIVASIEDVKAAIEKQRQELSQNYFKNARSAGQNLNAIADFFERLYQSTEYQSYIQAKQLLSHLEGIGARFSVKNIDLLLHQIQARDLIPDHEIKRSHLKGFMGQFEQADHQIQEKIRSQIRLLQQQVHYALFTDVRGAQSQLQSLMTSLIGDRSRALEFFENAPVELNFPADFETGPLELATLEVRRESEGVGIDSHRFAVDEQRALFEALLMAEESTLQDILKNFKLQLAKIDQKKNPVSLGGYLFTKGIAEYYVLCEIELFDPQIRKQACGQTDLLISAKHGDFVIRSAQNYQFFQERGNGT